MTQKRLFQKFLQEILKQIIGLSIIPGHQVRRYE